jgi:type IV secretory pathway TraG/TraD family ATPase VirD4
MSGVTSRARAPIQPADARERYQVRSDAAPSLWLDMLLLRLMNRGQPGHRPVWFVLDELASLQRLPPLHTAVTENRKSNNPVVLGFQGRSQLETRYGHDAEAMLSQPATKIFLRTSEPHAAKWISDTIGEIEIERMRESRSKGTYGQRTSASMKQLTPAGRITSSRRRESAPRISTRSCDSAIRS